MLDNTDEELMIAYANNQIDAFQVLYARYKTALFRFILRQVDNQAQAEELFQEVWSKIIKAKDNYTVNASFRTYIYQIARNTIIDSYRRQSIRRIESNETNPDNLQRCDNFDKTNDPSNKLEQQQNYQRVIDAIKELSPDQRDVFLLKQEAGLSIQEIANITQVNAETIKSRYRYAVNQLKTLLGA